MDATILEELKSCPGPLYREKIKKINPVTGGCIHQAWELILETGQKFFAKTCHRDKFAMLSFEADGLHILNKNINHDFLIVPEPLIVQQLSNSAILLMSWMDLNVGSEKKLGKGLALLHKESIKYNQNSFGWGKDGFIGSSPQIGGWGQNWGEFFVNKRLIPQLEMSQAWGMPSLTTELKTKMSTFLNKHKPSPSLVHGDLWKGNTSTSQSNKGVLYDPAIWWADREVDIAMTKLFGGFSKDFYIEYERIWKLPSDNLQRINIYNLYHLLNHANIFGGEYKTQCFSTMNSIIDFLN